MFVEMIGAMLITFLYLTQTEESTKMSADPAITTLIIAATYVAVVGFGDTSWVVSGTPYNPAASFGLGAAILFQGDMGDTSMTWIFLIFAYGGAVLAVLLFEFVYKPAMNAANNTNEEETSNEDRQEHDALMSPTAQ